MASSNIINKYFLIVVLAIMSGQLLAQKQKTENLIIITLDGFRWQEVFGGADSMLINDVNYSHDTAGLRSTFWASTADERRKKLLPFFWTTMQRSGQLYGNRWLGNEVNNANKYWFSYPGYNEIFTGFPDDSVNSNDKKWNKNVNVLEFINQQQGYKGKVAAFATWDAFPYILNTQRSGLYVNADTMSINFPSKELKLIDDMQKLTPRPIGVRPDLLTYFGGREYLKAYKPKVLYIAFDETDDFAHGGLYDQYLKSAFAQDAMIADLWNTVQSMPEYRGKTTLLITCDHGRGDKEKAQWKDHGEKVLDAGQIWIAAMGPDAPALGEVKTKTVLLQRQLATTFSSLLGFQFKPVHSTAEPIQTILHK